MAKPETVFEGVSKSCSMAGMASGGVPLPRVVRDALSVSDQLPRISQPLLTWFVWYSRRYLRRNFNSLRVTGAALSNDVLSQPLVLYSNHPSWWDPLVGLMITQELLPGKRVFAPMDAGALRRYGFFKRLGMFGVEAGTRRGAGQFLRQARTILQTPGTMIWLTPQGRFADSRERPVQFKSGIGHLPGMAREACFLPVAIEYVFWEERLPEILVRIGEPYRTTQADRWVKAEKWTRCFTDRMGETQDELARQAQRRDLTELRCLLRGRTGVGGVYDWWRRVRSSLKGENFQLEHGKL